VGLDVDIALTTPTPSRRCMSLLSTRSVFSSYPFFDAYLEGIVLHEVHVKNQSCLLQIPSTFKEPLKKISRFMDIYDLFPTVRFS
jgi:hypothetical protein